MLIHRAYRSGYHIVVNLRAVSLKVRAPYTFKGGRNSWGYLSVGMHVERGLSTGRTARLRAASGRIMF